MAWDMSLEGRLAVVTNADISSDVPNGICCGPFSMDVTTKHYVWDGSGTYQGSMAPDTQPNGRQDCTGGQDDALSCVNRYWGWVLSWEAGRIEFDHNSFVVTHDDQNNMYGWDVYYYWP